MTIYVELINNKPCRTTPFEKVALSNYEQYITTSFDDYTSDNPKYIIDDEKNIIINSNFLENELIKAKQKKLLQNTQLAKSAVENGFIEYKDTQIETNTQTVSDLIASMLILQTSTQNSENNLSYKWLSKDDKVINLSIDDFMVIGNLIAEFKNEIWNNKYIAYKKAIEEAVSVSEIDDIEIIY